MATAGMNTFCCQIDQTPQPAQWFDQRHKCSKWHGLCGCPKAHWYYTSLSAVFKDRGAPMANAIEEAVNALLPRNDQRLICSKHHELCGCPQVRFSRQVIGWSMGPRMDRDLAINALLMAVWRRQPQSTVMVHSDQGSQFSSYDWQAFLKAHNLQPSMSRRGNCHDNAVAESFFQLLKRERIRRKTYATRDEAKQDVFDYIEMFYNPKRRHSVSNRLSPVEYEKQYFERLASV